MKLFHLYVLKLFLKYIIIVQIFVTMMSVLSSSMGDSKMLSQFDYTFLDFVKTQMYAIGLNLNLAMPITTTVATIIVILLLMRSNELLAYVSLGGTIVSLAIPFITIGATISAGMIIWEYQVIPKIRIAREETLAEIRGETYIKQSYYVGLWLMDGDNTLVNIGAVDMAGGTLAGITEYTITDKSAITQIKTINSAVKNGDIWEVSGQRITDISSNPPTVNDLPPESLQNKLWDDLIRVAVVSLRALPPDQLKILSDVMKSRRMNVSQYDMLYYAKFANAISVIVLLILTFPIAINFSRNYSIVKNAALMFGLGLFFWMFQAACYSFGETGTLSPFYANFLPTFVFVAIGAGVVFRKERAR